MTHAMHTAFNLPSLSRFYAGGVAVAYFKHMLYLGTQAGHLIRMEGILL